MNCTWFLMAATLSLRATQIYDLWYLRSILHSCATLVCRLNSWEQQISSPHIAGYVHGYLGSYRNTFMLAAVAFYIFFTADVSCRGSRVRSAKALCMY